MTSEVPVNETAIKLLQTAQWLSSRIAHELAALDLTAHQIKVLSIIAHSPERRATVNDIKAQMFDPASNVSRMLNKLVTKGLVSKQREREDQRIVYIAISKQGMETMCLGRDAMQRSLACMDRLNECEQANLILLLEKLKT